MEFEVRVTADPIVEVEVSMLEFEVRVTADPTVVVEVESAQ